MIRNTIIALATVVAAGAAFSAPASAKSWHKPHYGYENVTYKQSCHFEKRKVFAGYDECGNKLWVWKRVRSCH